MTFSPRAWWSRRLARRRAGWRARAKYKAQRARWLRERRRTWLVICLAAIGFVAAFHLAMAWYPGNQTWISGALAGAMGAMIVALRQAPPTAIERWQEGAWGEEMTAKQLERLARGGWHVLNDVGNGQYNFDHVVVGPSGIFCLNSKKSAFALEADAASKSLRLVNRYDPTIASTDSRMLGQAKRDAARLSELIQQRSGHKVWVQPVIVWWGRFAQEGCTVANVGVVHGSRLIERLEGVAGTQPRVVQDPLAVVDALAPGRRRAA